MTSGLQSIHEFLACRRIAAAGVARDSRHFSRTIFRELRARGYDVVPVNPHASEIDGMRCYARVTDIDPPVEAALLTTTGAASEAVAQDCADAGVKHVWLYRAVGQGAVTPGAVAVCERNGISVVPGECIFMFLRDAGWIHAVHRLWRKAVGSYPA
ncbi:MAG TPA: CoA-binding protein [Bryobacteraceae bacterium]|nr:CoA-binding protein [Bryobacteraceae bacterium]